MTTTRAERVDEILRMRSQKISTPIIAAALGLAPNTVRNYLNDPDGAKERARKATYGGTCETCGAKTDGSNGRALAPKVCARCWRLAQHDRRIWNEARVLAAIRTFHSLHGRPPWSKEWLRSEDLAAAELRDGVAYPWTTTVLREFGTWLNAIRAAGYEPPDYPNRRKPDEFFFDRIMALSKNGVAPPYRAVASTVTTLRGRGYSWPGVLRHLGLEPRRRPSRTTEELLDALRARLVNGRMPYRKEQEAIGSALYKRGISWTEAADIIGAQPNFRLARRNRKPGERMS